MHSREKKSITEWQTVRFLIRGEKTPRYSGYFFLVSVFMRQQRQKLRFEFLKACLVNCFDTLCRKLRSVLNILKEKLFVSFCWLFDRVINILSMDACFFVVVIILLLLDPLTHIYLLFSIYKFQLCHFQTENCVTTNKTKTRERERERETFFSGLKKNHHNNLNNFSIAQKWREIFSRNIRRDDRRKEQVLEFGCLVWLVGCVCCLCVGRYVEKKQQKNKQKTQVAMRKYSGRKREIV